jgi:predicted ATPase/DNA-binding SARP family transcriptional activator
MSTPQPLGGASVKYSQQYRRCGRPNCPTCTPPGRGHGPYWYAYWWEDGRVRSRYLGKELPSAEPALQAVPVVASATTLRVRTLGSFVVWRSGEIIPASQWGRRKAAALFKCLLSAPGYRLHREQLIDLLMPEMEFDDAATALRSAVYRLRKVLDSPGAPASHLQNQGDLLALVPVVDGKPDEGWLDAAVFAREAAAALAGQDVARCRKALDLYGGEYLPEDVYEEWAERHRDGLRAQHLALLLHLAHLSQAAGMMDEALQCLRTVLTAVPCHEDAARNLMQLLVAAGRSGEALEVYRTLKAALEREIGASPGQETLAVRARLLAEAPLALLPPTRPTNLPAPLTSFVGREWELAEVSRLLREGAGGNRLVTLLGAGGCGKTRLALEVGRDLLQDFPDGVFLTELATVSDPARLPEAVADALGLREQAQRAGRESALDVLSSCLAPKRLLLVLDNCEHLVSGCAQLASVLLQRSPELRILTTSQAMLGVLGEIIWRVPSLSLPEAGPLPAGELAASEAVQLFLERAQASQPRFALTERNADAVAHICRRLDGIPLAIELAAARLSLLSAEQIAARLDDRLQLLSDGNRTALPRQQTLRATIEWSYNLLTAGEQVLLRRLAVFAGSWMLEAAEAVCASESLSRNGVVERLGGVMGKSLIQMIEVGETVRYRMLETVRQYAWEQLRAAGEDEAVRERHCGWYRAFVLAAEPELEGPRQAVWLQRIDAELDNIRAALLRHVEIEDTATGLEVTSALLNYWMIRGRFAEGRDWIERLLARTEVSGEAGSRIRARALHVAGRLAYLQGDNPQALARFEESLALCRVLEDSDGVLSGINDVGAVMFRQGEYARAEVLYQEALALRRDRGETRLVAQLLNNLATSAFAQGDFARGIALSEESLGILRALDDRYSVAVVLTNLGQARLETSDLVGAAAACDEGLPVARDLQARDAVARFLSLGGSIARQGGDYGHAWRQLVEALALYRDLGAMDELWRTFEELAFVALAARQYERSVLLLASGAACYDLAGTVRSPGEQAAYDRCVADTSSALGAGAFQNAWNRGRALPLEDAVSRALGVPLCG